MNTNHSLISRKHQKESIETSTKPLEKEVTYETRLSNLKSELSKPSITMPDRQVRRKNQKKKGSKNSKQERHRNKSNERSTSNPLESGKFQDIISKKKNTFDSIDREFEAGIPNLRKEDHEEK